MELAERYRKYEECLRRREEATKDDGALHVRVVEVLRSSDIVLSCFTCVAPEDGLEIESTYKPSAGSIGRAFKKVVDFFRRKLLGEAVNQKFKWTYDWEYAAPGHQWRSLTNLHSKKSIDEHISTKVRRFLKRNDAKWTLSDQFELRVKDVDRNNTGFYRCINKRIQGDPKDSKSPARIGSMHFVDVKTHIPFDMIESKREEISKKITKLLPNMTDDKLKIKVEARATSWSMCSQCGDRMGEQVRAVECAIFPLERLDPNGPSKWLNLVGSISCSSSLVPLSVMLCMFFFYSTGLLQSRCFSNSTMERYINSTDELGEMRVMDYLPKGEFLFGEILPKLLPPIIRRGYLITEGDPLVLTCDIDPYEGVGINWHSKLELNLNISRLLQKFQRRVWFDDQNRMIFNRVEMSDEDVYYCYSSERVLIGVHNVIILKNDQTKELIQTVEMVMKFGVLLFIAVLILAKLLG